MSSKEKYDSLGNNNIIYINNMAQTDETIKRKRGRPSKPTKVDKDIIKLNEIAVNGTLNNFYKEHIVGLYKKRKITRFNAVENLIKSINTNDIKQSSKIFQNVIKKYETKVGVKKKNQNKKIKKY